MRLRSSLLPIVAVLAMVAGPVGGAAARAEATDPGPTSWTASDITDANVARAVAAVPGLVATARARAGVPGMAVAIVSRGKVVLAAGYGERVAGSGLPVDADTVFQMASVSKPVGATVISRAVSQGLVRWSDPIRRYLPSFALDSAYVTRNVTIGDMYAHRSGLPDHAGDDLESIGYRQGYILDRLRYLPLSPFRAGYDYTNFGLAAGGVAVARAAKTTWANLADRLLFTPAGMTSSSYRFADYLRSPNKALTHRPVDGVWQHLESLDADPEAPAGGLSSTVNDMARWMLLQLGDGTIDGRQLIDPAVLQVMRQPHSVSAAPGDPTARPGLYGYGIGTGVDGTGHVRWSHSGAFYAGAGTTVDMAPAADLGIVVLSNGLPQGESEAVAASFLDIAETGALQRDWFEVYAQAFAPILVDRTMLAGRTPPPGATPARPLAAYVGTYSNEYVGDARVVRRGNGLVLLLGPDPMAFPLTAWGGNRFSYRMPGEGGLGRSAVDFRPDTGTVTIEQFDQFGLGTLVSRRR